MKKFGKIAAVFAFMAMLTVQVFAQENVKNRNFDENYVFEVLETLNSNDKTAVAEAQKNLEEMVEKYVLVQDSQMHNSLKYPILQFVEKFNNCGSKDFLFSILARICNENDVPDVFQLIDNERLADRAIRTAGEINGSYGYVEKYIIKHQDNLEYKAAFAYAIGKKKITSMENELVSWLDGADDNTKIEIYNALLVVGSNEKTTSIVEKGAKKLYKSKVVDSKIGGMRILTAKNGEKALPMLYKSLKDKNERVRKEALELLKPFYNQKVADKVVKKCKKDEALADAITWLGDVKDESHMELIIKGLSSDNKKVVEASIRAIFKIDNAEGINAVKPMFGGEYLEVIKDAMMTYKGDYREVLNSVFRGTDQQKLAVLQIVESRPELFMNTRVKDALNSANQDVRDEAYKILRLVVTVNDSEFLKALLENCSEKYVEDVQIAIKDAMGNAVVDKKNQFATTLKHVKPNIMPRFYKVFAYFETEVCIDKLIDAYKNGDYKEEAKEALLMVANGSFSEKINAALK